MLNVNNVIHNSIVDGPGIRTVIFFQGCTHNCVGCHNVDSHDFKPRNLYSVNELMEIIRKNSFSKKVTLSGGEPLQQNLNELFKLCKMLKAENYDICLFTGYLSDEIKNSNKKEIFDYINYLIEGPYVDELRNTELIFRGSSNQIFSEIKNKNEKGKEIL